MEENLEALRHGKHISLSQKKAVKPKVMAQCTKISKNAVYFYLGGEPENLVESPKLIQIFF